MDIHLTQDQPYRTEHLGDHELLATILGGERGGELARELMGVYGDLPSLGRASPDDLTVLRGLSAARTRKILAALELGRRAQAARTGRVTIRVSADVFAFYGPRLGHLTHEVFHTMCLDTKHRLVRDERVVEGGLTSCSVLPREALAPALRSASAAVVFVHNHPSGDPAPSSEDLTLTARLKQAGVVLGIKVLDHIIIGEGRYVSLVDEGLFGSL